MDQQYYSNITMSIGYSCRGTSRTAKLKLYDSLKLAPCAIEEITSLTMQLDKIEDIGDLAGIFLGSRDKMVKLRSLDVSLYASGSRREGILPKAHSNGDDPFKEFPYAHLTSLNLHEIHLYPSLTSITTLTEFVLHHYKLLDVLDTLLTFLESNRALERVELTVGFDNSIHRLSKRAPINLEQLVSLVVSGGCQEDIKCLVSHISLSKVVNLKIKSRTEKITSVYDMLSPIKAIATRPTHMHVDYKNNCVRLSEPNRPGDVNIDHISSMGMSSILKNDFLSSFGHIQELHLIGTSKHAPKFSPSFSRALKTFTIQQDSNVSTTLSPALSFWGRFRPSLDRLTIENCICTEDFCQRLIKYASRHNRDISWDHNQGTVTMVKGAASVAQRSSPLEFLGLKSRRRPVKDGEEERKNKLNEMILTWSRGKRRPESLQDLRGNFKL